MGGLHQGLASVCPTWAAGRSPSLSSGKAGGHRRALFGNSCRPSPGPGPGTLRPCSDPEHAAQVRQVRLFQDEEIYSDLYLTVCEWPSDASKVIVFGFK